MSAAQSGGASLGQKVKGAFQAVHGMGESIRGNAMDFVDSATGTEHKGRGAAVQGQREAETGVANMEGRPPQHMAGPGTAPTTTQTAPSATAASTATTAPAATAGPAATTAPSATTATTAATAEKTAYPPGSSTGF